MNNATKNETILHEMARHQHQDTSDDFSADEFDLETFLFVKSVVGIFLFFVFLIGTPANLVVARCAWKLCQRTSSRCSTTTLYQFFVLSMTVADLLYVSIVAPSMSAQYYLRVQFSYETCACIHLISHLSTVASSLSLLSLNIEKFIGVSNPLHHASIVTKSRVKFVAIFCWLLSFGWSMFFIFGPAMTYIPKTCSYDVDSFVYYLIFAVCFFVAPTLLAGVFGCFIAAIAYQSERAQLSFKVPNQLEKDLKNSHLSSPIHRQRYQYVQVGRRSRMTSRRGAVQSTLLDQSNNSKKSISKMRTFTFVFSQSIWTICSYVPYRIFYLIYISSTFRAWHLPVGFALFSCMAANPAGNAYITIITQRRYRMLISKFWRQNFLRTFALRITGSSPSASTDHRPTITESIIAK